MGDTATVSVMLKYALKSPSDETGPSEAAVTVPSGQSYEATSGPREAERPPSQGTLFHTEASWASTRKPE